MYVIFQYLNLFFENRLKEKKRLIVLIGFRFLVSFIVDDLAPVVWINIITGFICMFLLTLCYDARFRKRIVVSMAIFMLTILSEGITALVIGLGGFGFFERAANDNLFALFLSRLFFWGIYLIIKRFKHLQEDTPLPKTFFLCSDIIMVVSAMQMSLVYSQQEIEQTKAMLSLLGLGMAVYTVIFLYDVLSSAFRERTKLELARKEKEFYHRESQLLQKSQEDTRKFQHDLRNRMQVIEDMAEKKEWDELKRYVSQVAEKSKTIDLYSQTGNLALDSIINCKLDEAKEKGIEVNSVITLPGEIITDEDDMIVIVGNLLDNAMEAAEKVKKDSYIQAFLRYEEGCLYLRVENSYDGIIKEGKDGFLTRKKEKELHGLGIRSVQDSVTKYQGEMEFSHDEKKFCVDVMLYLTGN